MTVSLLNIGISFSAAILGYFIAASNTPVLGVAITSLIGFIGILYPKVIENGTIDKEFTGKLLCLFATGMIFGVALGQIHRVGIDNFLRNDTPPIFWDKLNDNLCTKHYLEWTKVALYLDKIGYNDSQIETLYNHWEKQFLDGININSNYCRNGNPLGLNDIIKSKDEVINKFDMLKGSPVITDTYTDSLYEGPTG